MEGHTLVVVAFDHLQEIHAQDLKYHHEMLPVWTMMEEAVKQLYTVAVVASDALKLARVFLVVALQGLKPLRLHPVRASLVENLHLVEGRFKVVGRGALDLEGNISVIVHILGEPDCREVAPAELLDDHISLNEDLTHVHRVVAPYLVVREALVL